MHRQGPKSEINKKIMKKLHLFLQTLKVPIVLENNFNTVLAQTKNFMPNIQKLTHQLGKKKNTC